MDSNLRKALYIILISLGLAVIFNFLFFGKEIGISVFIFVSVLLTATSWFGKYQQLPIQKTWWLLLFIAFFALMPSIRANDFLNFLNVCTSLGLLMFLAHELIGTPTFLMKLSDYFVSMVMIPLGMLERAFHTLSLIGQIHSNVKHRDVWIRVIKGVIMAVPVLVVFSLLFSQADLVFSRFLSSFVTIRISESTMQYLLLLLFAFMSALSFFSYIFFSKKKETTANEKPNEIAISGRGTEVMVFLGLISILFLVFIVFQFTYLFGGEANIVNAGFTYAEYARRGFWELLAVAMLSLLVLLASEKYAKAELKKDKQFLIPAIILIAQVIIVIFSAFKRLSLYIDAYGMSLLRFYVAGFIILLLALFVLLAIKFITSKQEQFFAFGTLLLGLAFLVVLNLINPDAFIAQANLDQFNKTGKVDVNYVGRLSTDAVSQKIELYKKLELGEKENLGQLLKFEQDNLQNNYHNWQSSNLSRSRALKLLQNFQE